MIVYSMWLIKSKFETLKGSRFGFKKRVNSVNSAFAVLMPHLGGKYANKNINLEFRNV